MPGGWGRRATGKIDRKLEDDALFKEIGGQLEATNFDYSQWQRTGKSSKLNITRRPTPQNRWGWTGRRQIKIYFWLDLNLD